MRVFCSSNLFVTSGLVLAGCTWGYDLVEIEQSSGARSESSPSGEGLTGESGSSVVDLSTGGVGSLESLQSTTGGSGGGAPSSGGSQGIASGGSQGSGGALSTGGSLGSGGAPSCDPAEPLCRGPIVHFKLDADPSDAIGLATGEEMEGMLYSAGVDGQAGDFRGGTQHVRADGMNVDGNTAGPLDPDDMTMSFWVNVPAATAGWNQMIVQKGRSCLASYQCGMYGGEMTCGVNHGGGWCPEFRSVAGTMVPDVWHHVAFTVQRETAPSLHLRLYVDGVLVDSLDTPESYPPVLSGGDYYFVIGSNYADAEGTIRKEEFTGQIDDVRLYDDWFTQPEVTTLFESY